MERLYCPECGDYLEGGDGSMVDCHCGWKQERSLSSDEDEIDQLRQRVQELEELLKESYKDADEVLRPRVAELEKERDDLLRAFNEPVVKSEWQKLIVERDALKQQRDELVVAATKAAEEIRKCDYTPARSTLLVVIASVKEQA